MKAAGTRVATDEGASSFFSKFQKIFEPLLQAPTMSSLAIPDYEAFPTQFCQTGPVFLVAFLVIAQLRQPIIGIRFRLPTIGATSMLVPEAAVDKDDFSLGWENEIRPTWQISPM